MSSNTTTTAAIVSALVALRTRNGKSKSAKTGADSATVRKERISAVFTDLFSCMNGGGYATGRNPAQLAEWTELYGNMSQQEQTEFQRSLAVAVAAFVDKRTQEEAERLAQSTSKEKRKTLTFDVMALLS